MSSFRQKSLLCAVALVSGGLLAPQVASAGSVTIADTYYGGINTYNGADVIGDPNVFDIKDAVIQRIGPGGGTLQVVIDTNYAGAPGTSAADGTGYGALFITPGANSWNPTGPAPYTTDVYTPGEWAYAFTVPQTPSGSSGTAQLYSTNDGSVVMSNVHGDPITYPYPGNPGYYFRQGQAVQFTPSNGAVAVAGGSWAAQPGKLTFNIDDNHLLGDAFSFSWAMTCGNDVIQGMVGGVPEPGTWAMMILGFLAVGSMARMQRRKLATAAIAAG